MNENSQEERQKQVEFVVEMAAIEASDYWKIYKGFTISYGFLCLS